MNAILTIIIGGAVLFLYTRFEKRIQQRPCSECGVKISVDTPEEKCSDCRSFI
jgi:hypothetical protein